MTERKDILANPGIKDNPFTTPEGYFTDFQSRITESTVHAAGETSLWTKLLPAMATAAAFLMLVTVGNIILRTSTKEEYTFEDFMVFSDRYSGTGYEMNYGELYAEAEISDDDIIEYLIYTGVDTETIELYK